MSYEAETKRSEKAARRACPIAFALCETLLALRQALESAGSEPGRLALVQSALEDAGIIPAAASRAAVEGSPMPYDATDEQARAVLESVGLVPTTCQERIGPVSRCSHRGNPCGRHEVRA